MTVTERYEVDLFDAHMGQVETRRIAGMGEAFRTAAVWMAEGNGAAYVYRQVPVTAGRGRGKAERWSRPMPVYKMARRSDGTINEITEFAAGGDLPTILGIRQ